jgi:hypothetical protein
MIRVPRVVRRALERLPPYPALLVLAVPLSIVEPLKLTALFVAGEGHFVAGTVVLGCAYAVSLFITHRLFVIVRPTLMRLPWFAALWRRFVALRGRVRLWLRGRRGGRKGLWLWQHRQ